MTPAAPPGRPLEREAPDGTQVELSAGEFSRAAELLRTACGIRIREGKEMMVRARLAPRVRELGCASVNAYLDLVESGGEGGELPTMIDLLTTNKTGFFREPRHFEFLRREVFPALARTAEPARFWSAGCSSGEEPYTLSIVCLEAGLPQIERRPAILATDISRPMLASARRGIYGELALDQMPDEIRERHLRPVEDRGQPAWEVLPAVRASIRFAALNLIKTWPMAGPFDVIFFRNVAIYFERATQMALVARMTRLLRPGGYLFIGHSETLSGENPELSYVQPAIYRRKTPAAGQGETRK